MEDSLSVKSNESTGTSDDFDFVSDKPGSSRTPVLDCGGGLNELKDTLAEVLKETESQTSTMSEETPIEDNKKTVGQSTFYGSPVDPGKDPLTIELSPTEKQDPMKPDEFSEEDTTNISDVDQECTIFSGVTYLGAAQINAPKSEAEIHRNMAILNEQSSDQGIKVSISIPLSPTGVVVLYDATANQVISRYEIHRILFFARGPTDTKEESCFAFTWSHGDPQENAILQCHVFRCEIVEAVWRVSGCFSKAFHPKVPRSMSSSVTSTADIMSASVTTISEPRTLMYVFEVNLEIREDDGKGSFTTVGKDRNGFRLRTNIEKQLAIGIKQVSDNGPQLIIERCFGVLVAAGRDVKHSDMQLLEMKERKKVTAENNCTSIVATWDPTEKTFETLNTETPKDFKQFMTVAVDLVIRGIQEPVRFLLETSVRIFSQNERGAWYFQKRSMIQQFFLNLKEVVSADLTDVYYEVLSMDHSGELDRNLLNLSLNFSSFIQSPTSIASMDAVTPKDEEQSDNDEPLLSGTGLVSKDCSEDVLVSWGQILTKWKLTNQRPKELTKLVREGIPEALRGAVWQRLAGVEENCEIMRKYNTLLSQESGCENVIQRDIARTFPAHDFFKEAGGLGQDSLYKVSKAYALYDQEVGYCQGLSFLAATLLLHMPEEEAFCVLVKLMYDYKLRDLYKDGFDNLYLRLYQLNRLMEEQLAPLYIHFEEHRIETHMFASQWFLTLFTARFPLYFVFHIIDVFLLQGIDTLFQMALALLTSCKKDLLQLDFEGILKYFRVTLPKKCRSEESAQQLIKLACSIKVKKLKKYEADFIHLKEVAAQQEEKASEVEILNLTLTRLEDEKRMMLDEIVQLKEMLKREVEVADSEKEKNKQIMDEYQVVRQRLDVQLKVTQQELEGLKASISNCPTCSENLKKGINCPANNGNGEQLIGEDRIRELELQLAQTKLAHVEAECKNQNLTHQLRAIEQELAAPKNTWMSKALTSIKEVANKKDFAHLGSGMQGATFISHINSAMSRGDSIPLRTERDHKISKEENRQVASRRDSVPLRTDKNILREDNVRRESAPVIKDSQSFNSLKSQN